VILEVKKIDTYYGLGHILHGLSLQVEEGEVVALLGRNGAGKTTTLRSITGLTPPRAGAIRYKGRDIAGLEPHEVSRIGVALVPETRDIFSYLTVKENLLIAQRKASRWQMETVLERFPKLKDRMGNKGRELSGGEQQMLAIARALVRDPKIILLDEPFEGLAPIIVRDLLATCRALAQGGQTILIVEQNISAALSIADRVYVLRTGHVVEELPAEALRAQPEVLHRHLGV
jgi:branched-chain amino acid transport system ATP-binding protein